MDNQKNKIIVRTDLMDPVIYLEIELYFKELIKNIYDCGGYAFFSQICKYYKSNKNGYKNIQKMIDLNIVGQAVFNKNKYIYLKGNAVKYMTYKDIEILPEKLSINKISKYFSTLYSFFKFEYCLVTSKLITFDLSDKSLDLLINFIKKLLDTNRMDNLHHINIVKDDYIQGLHNTFKAISSRFGLYIVGFNENEYLSNSILKFVYFDKGFNTDKNLVYMVLRKISLFLNKLGTRNNLNCCKFNLEIVTDNKRIESLKNLENKALKEIEKNNQYKNKDSKSYKVTGLNDITYTVLQMEKYFKSTIRENLKFFKDGEFEKLFDI